MASKLLLLCLVAACWTLAASYPIHASCKLTWTFSVNCTFVNGKIAAQMNAWSGTSCGTGEKCGYKITSQSASEIKGTHTTPVHHYVDDLTMAFTASGSGCSVTGFSTSETWYAVLDYGTNYCNLHNLVDGAKIDTSTYGFKEQTSDSQCTQYTSHNCGKY